jgi:hypothetical protein
MQFASASIPPRTHRTSVSTPTSSTIINKTKCDELLSEYAKSLQSIVTVMAVCNKATVASALVDDFKVLLLLLEIIYF